MHSHSSHRFASNEEIDERLEKLENEWDIERTLEAKAAAFSLTGLALGRR